MTLTCTRTPNRLTKMAYLEVDWLMLNCISYVASNIVNASDVCFDNLSDRGEFSIHVMTSYGS